MATPEYSPEEDAPSRIEVGIGTLSSFGSITLPYIQGPNGMIILDGDELRDALVEQRKMSPLEKTLVFISPSATPLEPTPQPAPQPVTTYTPDYLRAYRKPTELMDGRVVIDPERRRVTSDGVVHTPAAKVFDLIQLLSLDPGKTFKYEELMLGVWGHTNDDSGTLKVHASRARRHLPEDTIVTVEGIGYWAEP